MHISLKRMCLGVSCLVLRILLNHMATFVSSNFGCIFVLVESLLLYVHTVRCVVYYYRYQQMHIALFAMYICWYN